MENETCYEKLIKNVDMKKNAIVFDNHVLHMRTVVRAVDGLARALSGLGFTKGDVLTLYLPTTPQAVVAFYACSKIGVAANFVHPLVPLEQLKQNLAETKSKGLMYYDVLIKNGKQLSGMGQTLIKCSIGDFHFFRKIFYKGYVAIKNKDAQERFTFASLIKTKGEGADIITGNGEDVACMMHSGGTAGQPKIVKLSNNALNGVATALDSFADVEAGKEYTLAALPVFHAYGLGVSVHTALVKKYNLILMSKFNAQKANRLMRRYPVTMFAGVPVMFKKMAECANFSGKHLQRLQLLWCGGDAVSTSFVDSVNFTLRSYGSKARLMPGYGLTEVCGVCTANTAECYNKKSCGKPIPGTTVEIWDDNENRLAVNSVGEVVISSPCIMSGYLSGESGIVEKEGRKWVKTGDVGYLDADGYLYIVDRMKRSVKINAINVFPAEIETLVRTKDYVDEACAVPYRLDNKIYIRLFVTAKGEVGNENKLKKDLLSFCQQNLIKYAVPKEIVFLDEMPRTKFGKVDYHKFEVL